jgi:ribosomal protein L25 (general stress protein Ctc)
MQFYSGPPAGQQQLPPNPCAFCDDENVDMTPTAERRANEEREKLEERIRFLQTFKNWRKDAKYHGVTFVEKLNLPDPNTTLDTVWDNWKLYVEADMQRVNELKKSNVTMFNEVRRRNTNELGHLWRKQAQILVRLESDTFFKDGEVFFDFELKKESRNFRTKGKIPMVIYEKDTENHEEERKRYEETEEHEEENRETVPMEGIEITEEKKNEKEEIEENLVPSEENDVQIVFKDGDKTTPINISEEKIEEEVLSQMTEHHEEEEEEEEENQCVSVIYLNEDPMYEVKKFSLSDYYHPPEATITGNARKKLRRNRRIYAKRALNKCSVEFIKKK